ncbi:MAG: hypothetical protein KA715_06825 [Xanthomonadaceae bacterium]|nr:hypothetical protein [Xanthomonadaceae bacterium]
MKIFIVSFIFISVNAFATNEPNRVHCYESKNNETAWEISRSDSGALRLSVLKKHQDFDRMTCGSRWGCDVHNYWEAIYEEHVKIILKHDAGLIYQGKRNTLRINLISKNEKQDYDASISYPAKYLTGEWYIVNRKLFCSLIFN